MPGAIPETTGSSYSMAVPEDKKEEDDHMDEVEGKKDGGKVWEGRRWGQWMWVKDAYCGHCNHHHYCGSTQAKKENAEGDKKEKQKSVDSEDMHVEQEKDQKKECQDPNKDAKDEKKGWQDWSKDGGGWSAESWAEWAEAKKEKKVRESAKVDCWNATMASRNPDWYTPQ